MKSDKSNHSLYREKKVTKKVYINIINLNKFYNRMNTIFMNSENSKATTPHRLLLNLTDKTKIKRRDKYVAL